jgi:non-canonical (house-cleaning) NTP pyrophosphatase
MVAVAVRWGAELGAAAVALRGVADTRGTSGAVGALAAALIDRQQARDVLVARALSPFLAPALRPACTGYRA